MAEMKLPKFLIADDGGERGFVVHCHYPRFILEFTDEEGIAEFIDAGAENEPEEKLNQLMVEAGEFYQKQVDSYDEEDEE